MTLITSLSGTIFIGKLGLATVNLYTKFEVCICTCYEDMKGGEKCKNGEVKGHSRSLVNGTVTI